jgi:hypothetical protein
MNNRTGIENILLEAEEELTNLTALDRDERVDTPEELARLAMRS